MRCELFFLLSRIEVGCDDKYDEIRIPRYSSPLSVHGEPDYITVKDFVGSFQHAVALKFAQVFDCMHLYCASPCIVVCCSSARGHASGEPSLIFVRRVSLLLVVY